MTLEARGLSFGYSGDMILHEADLSLDKGEILALLGANGCGKTTLIRLLCGYLRPNAGEIRLDSVELSRIPHVEAAKHLLGVTSYAAPALDFTVEETVLLGRNARLPRLSTPSADDLAQTKRAINELHLSSFAGRELATLSNGERQKVMLAAALASGAEFLLLDEPTSALDPARTAEVMRLLRTKLDSRGILISTHDVNLAARFADRVALLSDGRVFACGKPEEVFTPPNLYRLYKLGVEIDFGAKAGMRIEFKS